MPPPMTRTSTSVRSRCYARRQSLYDRTVHMYTEPTSHSRDLSRIRPPPTRPEAGPHAGVLLLQTTLRLIADEGIDAVSHRSVAEAAGVPLGSTTYWFSSRQEMLRQALEYFARLEIETLHERLGAVLGKAPLPPPAGRRVHRPARAAARRAALADGRAVRALQEAARQPELSRSAASGRRPGSEALGEVFASLGSARSRARGADVPGDARRPAAEQLAAPDQEVERTVIRPALDAWFARIPTINPEAEEVTLKSAQCGSSSSPCSRRSPSPARSCSPAAGRWRDRGRAAARGRPDRRGRGRAER